MLNYSKLTVAELREECKKKGIDTRGHKKVDLINLLKAHTNTSSAQSEQSVSHTDSCSQLSKIKERMARFRCKNGEQTMPQSLAEDIDTMEKIQARKNRFSTNKK